MTHVRTSPYYPQSNGKIERWHKSLKGECIRPGTPLTPQDARRLVQQYVDHYNKVRLHSAIGFITPRTCSPVARRRFMLSGIASWRRRENSGRFVGRGPRKEPRAAQCPATLRSAARVLRVRKRYAV